MSRTVRKHMLSMVNLLEKATRETEKLLNQRCAAQGQLSQILTDCQNAALAMGNGIEAVYGEGTASVKELEDYCENLYQLFTAENDCSKRKAMLLKLKQQVKKLYALICQDIPDKLEVVFLPYKASMWDSLESIWKAARDDKDTDAFVIPIPYYDKNPDGSFREMYYEGAEYPDYVPVVKYDEYDFEHRLPDVIYIHNPYDNNNHVTSVHPFFYSKNLKKFTDKLVYIPYFILDEVNPENDDEIEKVKDFCIQPGVINSDKVILQSKEMKEIYVGILTEASGGTKEIRKYWEKKIDGSGSPKVDKVLNTKGDLPLPEQWMDIVRNPDGSRKKIVFYNTGISVLLKNNEQALKKIESVFRTFYEYRDKIALLWRPHPLMESTIMSMRPQLWEKYKEIREKYIDEKWGIYDDSAQLDRAIAVSDAYYGDESSVVHLYKRTLKPVMIQDCWKKNSVDFTNGIPIWCEKAVKVGEQLWFSSSDFNGLCCMDLNTGKIEYVKEIPDGLSRGHRLYTDIKYVEQQLILSPCNAESIAVYNMDSKEFRSYPLNLEGQDICYPEDKIRFAEVSGENIYLFGSAPVVIRFNWKTGEQKNIGKSNRELVQLYREKKIIANSGTRVGELVYAVVSKTNQVLVFDLQEEKSEIITVGKNDWRFYASCYDGENLWLAGDGILIKYSLMSGEYKIIKESQNEVYRQCCYMDGSVYFNTMLHDAAEQNVIYVVDKEENSEKIIDCIPETIYEFSRWRTQVLALAKENEIFWDDTNKNELIWMRRDGIQRYDMVIPADTLKKIRNDIIYFKDIIQEGAFSHFCSLHQWLDCIATVDCREEKQIENRD